MLPIHLELLQHFSPQVLWLERLEREIDIRGGKNFPAVPHEHFRLLDRDSSPQCHRDLQKKLIPEIHKGYNVFTAIEVSIKLGHGQV